MKTIALVGNKRETLPISQTPLSSLVIDIADGWNTLTWAFVISSPMLLWTILLFELLK